MKCPSYCACCIRINCYVNYTLRYILHIIHIVGEIGNRIECNMRARAHTCTHTHTSTVSKCGRNWDQNEILLLNQSQYHHHDFAKYSQWTSVNMGSLCFLLTYKYLNIKFYLNTKALEKQVLLVFLVSLYLTVSAII